MWSLMSSFNLSGKGRGGAQKARQGEPRWGMESRSAYSNVRVGSPEATVNRSWVRSAGSVSTLTYRGENGQRISK